MKITETYKYLGLIFDEYVDFKTGIGTLADAGGRALGAVISKFKYMRDVGYKTYTKLYESAVVPVVDYFSAIWGSVKSSEPEKIHNTAMRYFLGFHEKTPILGMHGDMGWREHVARHRIEIFVWPSICFSGSVSPGLITARFLLGSSK